MTRHSKVELDQRDIYLECLLSPLEAAGLLRVCVKTVHKLVNEKKLACVQVTARDRRFTSEQVQEYIRSQSTEVRVDKRDPRVVSSRPKKGGVKSSGDTVRAQLREEMRSWQ